MAHRHQNQVDQDGTRITRRNALRRFSTVGLGATLAAGAAGILSADPAMAKTRGKTRQEPYFNLSGKANPDCCATCVRNEGHCGVAHCANGGCCFTCSGCGLGTRCLPVSCAIGTVITYCP